MRAVPDPSRLKALDQSSVLLHCRDVMDEENRFENLGQEGNSSLGRCFKAFFVIPSGSGDLLNLRTLMAS